MFSKLQMPLLLTSQCHHHSSASNFCRARSSTAAGTDVDTEVLSYISASHTYVGNEGLAFWNSTSAFPSLAPFGQDLLAAPASRGLCGTCFQCLWSSHCRKEKSSLQETSQQRFWKRTISFTVDFIWLSNIVLRTYTTETETERQQLK